MIVSLIILSALVIVGIILYAEHQWHLRKTASTTMPVEETPQSNKNDTDSICCGLHEICEKGLDKIVYYDDEELDRYRGRSADEYNPSEADDFRDVLLTMPRSDIAGWARSLQQRQIDMPLDVRDEMMLILSEIN